ncbi:MAG: glnG 1, partial [Planctomycetaceae bacterium]|nr:glnG 1 [Planctomycetaceae bacterium]
MREPTARCESRRSKLPLLPLRQARTTRDGEKGCSAGIIESPPPDFPLTPQASRSATTLRTLGLNSDRPDAGFITQLLLIDDDPGPLPEQLRKAFPAPAHRVLVTGTSRGGLAYVRADTPDVIILSLGRSGWDLYQQIRHINANVPIIVVTGAKRADVVAITAIMQGAHDCLFTPVESALLQRVVG